MEWKTSGWWGCEGPPQINNRRVPIWLLTNLLPDHVTEIRTLSSVRITESSPQKSQNKFWFPACLGPHLRPTGTPALGSCEEITYAKNSFLLLSQTTDTYFVSQRNMEICNTKNGSTIQPWTHNSTCCYFSNICTDAKTSVRKCQKPSLMC